MSETTELTLPVARLALDNDESRRVLWTGGEVHGRHDQLLRFVAGTGQADARLNAIADETVNPAAL